MNYTYIEQLLDKYFDAQTDQAEEEILRIFFSRKEIPAHLTPFAAIFQLAREEKGAHTGEDFDQRLMQRIGMDAGDATPHVKARRMTLSRRLQPLGRAAAAVAIVALVGGSIQRAYMTNIIEPIERAEYANATENNATDGTEIETTPMTPAKIAEDSRKMAINADTLLQAKDTE